MEPIRWGILGTGNMASRMTGVIDALPEGHVVAVGSRRLDTAAEFAAAHDVATAVGSYEELALLGDVDAVYVATTNDAHHDNVLACLRAGKAVLCEKPLAVDTGQATAMVVAARSTGVFLMEAMWMRFQPFLAKLDELIAARAVGPVRHVQADFGFPAAPDPSSRWFAPSLGGGSLLDLGVYPLTLAYHLLGPPDEWRAVATPAMTGVDEQIGVTARHRGGALSSLSATLSADTAIEATVAGPEGRLRVHAPFHHSARITWHRRGTEVEGFDVGYEGDGLRFEVEEVHRCLRAGHSESPRMPLADSLALARWITDIHHTIGVAYPRA